METIAMNIGPEAAVNELTPNQNDTIDNSVSPAIETAGISSDVSTANLPDNTCMSTVGTSDVSGNDLSCAVTSSADALTEEVTFVIDPAKKLELEEKFNELINNPRYWENPNRISRLETALILPVYDDASMRMFYGSAHDELVLAEYKKAKAEKRTPLDITEEQIMELAEYKYHQKYVIEPALKAEREAKKKKKSA